MRGQWKRKEKGSGLWSTPVAARAPRNVHAKQCIVVLYSPAEYELAFRLRVDDMAATCKLQFDSLPLRFARFGHARFACTHVTHVLVEGVLEKGQPGTLVRVGPCARKTTNPNRCKCRACFNSGLVDGCECAVQRTARQLPNLYLYSYNNNNLSIYLILLL